MALLAHLLVGYGSMIGRSAHYVVEDTNHYTNEFVVLVGRTSKGRKGTSEGRIRRVLRAVDEQWDCDHVVSGLSRRAKGSSGRCAIRSISATARLESKFSSTTV